MEIKDKELDHGVLKVTMTGSLDVAGSDVADAHFAAIDQSKTRIVADLTHVDFLASVGIRVSVKTAKALGGRGGGHANGFNWAAGSTCKPIRSCCQACSHQHGLMGRLVCRRPCLVVRFTRTTW